MENTNTEDRYPVAPFSLFCEHYQVPRTWGTIAEHFLASDTIHITAVAEYITNYSAFWRSAESHNPNVYKGSPLG